MSPWKKRLRRYQKDVGGYLVATESEDALAFPPLLDDPGGVYLWCFAPNGFRLVQGELRGDKPLCIVAEGKIWRECT